MNRNDDKYRERMVDYLNGDLTRKEAEALREELEKEGIDLSQLDDLEKLGGLLDELNVPEPGSGMRARFYAMLEQEKARSTRKTDALNMLLHPFSSREFPSIFPKLAYGTLILLFGFIIGQWAAPGGKDHAQTAQMMEEIQNMKKMMALTLFEQPSASDRLKAVSYTGDIQKPDEVVIHALLKTLDSDPSVNVRLASLDALMPHTGNPKVREGLVRSISNQDSPLVQVAIADLMTRIGEHKAIPELEKLLQRKDLNESVAEKLKESISVLT